MVDWSASIVALLPIMSLVAVGVYFANRMLRNSERRRGGAADAHVAQLEDRVKQLEEAFGSLSTEVQRIGDAEQFTSRLLHERGAAERSGQ